MDIECFPETLGTEAILLVCSFVFSGLIGLEREVRQKSAGARTHILVGMGAALYTLVSAYGFAQVLGEDVVRIGRASCRGRGRWWGGAGGVSGTREVGRD